MPEDRCQKTDVRGQMAEDVYIITISLGAQHVCLHNLIIILNPVDGVMPFRLRRHRTEQEISKMSCFRFDASCRNHWAMLHAF